MFKICLITLTLLGVACSTQLSAQSASDADQKSIEETYNAFMTAFEQGDAKPLGAWVADNVESIGPDGNIVRGRANVVAMYAQLFEFLKTLPKPTQSETKLVSKQTRYLATDLVLYTYVEEATRHFGDNVQVEKTAFSVTLRKTGSKWVVELITLTPVRATPGQ